MSDAVIGTFSRKSGFTIVKLAIKKNGDPGKRGLKYIGKTSNNKEDYDKMSILEVMEEIRVDLMEEFNKEITLKLTTARSGRIYFCSSTSDDVEEQK
jgi:5-formaminoimidazole-4-carboxamide-1-beta-D-ribofuranosyl 5'-monophosphate synthetase